MIYELRSVTLFDIICYFTGNYYSGTYIKAFGSDYVVHMKLSVSKLSSNSTRNQHKSHQNILPCMRDRFTHAPFCEEKLKTMLRSIRARSRIPNFQFEPGAADCKMVKEVSICFRIEFELFEFYHPFRTPCINFNASPSALLASNSRLTFSALYKICCWDS
jgi:hypothetical protein